MQDLYDCTAQFEIKITQHNRPGKVEEEEEEEEEKKKQRSRWKKGKEWGEDEEQRRAEKANSWGESGTL